MQDGCQAFISFFSHYQFHIGPNSDQDQCKCVIFLKLP